MDNGVLVKLSARAWCLPILAHLAGGVPARQAPLIAATGAGRTAFGQSLQHLMDLHLLERNPGHGHPLRPEFRLTALGAPYAQMAARIMDVPQVPETGLLKRAWTLPVLTRLSRPRPFGGIRTGLPGVTDRALSISLKKMEDAAWIARDVDVAARPPRPIYRAINQGALIGQVVWPAMSGDAGGAA